MSAVIGIDLGTTNTVVAAVRDGRAMALPTETGERLFPSVVSFHPNGSVLVGREAKRRRLQDAANTVYSTKRLIGRSYDSEEVRKARSRSAFVIQEGPGRGVLVEARGETYTLSEISAFVLKEAKRIAESTGEVVDRAVITVPANFNDLQRAATKVAGHIAGLEVQRILNEPTAAALAYGYGKGNQERIAVFDFGGGTFDVTLLDLAGSVFEVLATAGDTFLGGDDIDLAIAERMAERYLKTHRYDARADRQVFERLLASAEEIKIRLSASDVATVQLQEIAFGVGGKSLDMPFSMTRLELEQLAAPLVDRALGV
ncbi:MAG TPA: Hsp70 family protein, partial [Polyangiaceae bacterium]|nr:Hsp70 family protein [Polyangiaceae bacterium]